MKIYRYMKAALALCLLAPVASGCSDMLDTESDMVEFVEDNTLSTPEDTLYSVMGIIQRMQVIADRTVLLGEVRADLMAPTNKATTAIKQMAAHDFTTDNPYNSIADFYAVINNCNYFLANVDTAFVRLGKKIFEKEYAAVKTYRAWTYLQMAKIYGKVPLVTAPVLTEAEAALAMNKDISDITAICNYFIDDIKPYVDQYFPQYGTMDIFNSKKFFIPVRVLLGEMCLWTGRYQEAATYLNQYLTMKNEPVSTGTTRVTWYVSDLNFATGFITSSGFSTDIASHNNVENISIIPMEDSEFDGVKSLLANVFESTINNDYYAQVVPSQGLLDLSAAQNYVLLNQTSDTQKDTIYAPKTNLRDNLMRGDVRLYGTYSNNIVNRSETSRYSSEVQSIKKLTERFVSIYRVQEVYLLYAEALCRAGYPESAFCILKYGLREQMIERHISEKERELAAAFLNFSDEDFSEWNTRGIHSRGSGDIECDDSLYVIPTPMDSLASYEDTVQYRIPLVEDMIMTERALELAFEGRRYYDLMRIAMRRGDNSYLAAPIANRTGVKDEVMYNQLMDDNNWYLPLK